MLGGRPVEFGMLKANIGSLYLINGPITVRRTTSDRPMAWRCESLSGY